jgi:hypothetical protein
MMQSNKTGSICVALSKVAKVNHGAIEVIFPGDQMIDHFYKFVIELVNFLPNWLNLEVVPRGN